MERIALGIEYLGHRYCGWQFQSHCDTVQQRLQEALSLIANETIAVQCAGRTDSGVNAIGQVVHFDTTAVRSDRGWLHGVNTKLPDDVRVSWVRRTNSDFHARFTAMSRRYRYVVFNREVHSGVLANRVTWDPRPLNAVDMHEAVQALVGEHDFSSFRASGCQAAHANRHIHKIKVSRQGDFLFIDIQANAFLHHMVRNIVGSLLEVGRGEKTTRYMHDLLLLKDREQAGVTAPAAGLYFVAAMYPEKWNMPEIEISDVLWGSI